MAEANQEEEDRFEPLVEELATTNFTLQYLTKEKDQKLGAEEYAKRKDEE